MGSAFRNSVVMLLLFVCAESEALTKLHNVGATTRRFLRKKTHRVKNEFSIIPQAPSRDDFWNQGSWENGSYSCSPCKQAPVLEKSTWYGFGTCGATEVSGNPRKSAGGAKVLGSLMVDTDTASPPPPVPRGVACPLNTREQLVTQALQALVDAGYTKTARFANKTRLFYKLEGPGMFLAPANSAYDGKHLPSMVRSKIFEGAAKSRKNALKQLLRFHLLQAHESYHEMLTRTDSQYNTLVKRKTPNEQGPYYQLESQAFCYRGKQYLSFQAVPATKRKALVDSGDLFCNNLVRIHGVKNALIPPNLREKTPPGASEDAPAPSLPPQQAVEFSAPTGEALQVPPSSLAFPESEAEGPAGSSQSAPGYVVTAGAPALDETGIESPALALAHLGVSRSAPPQAMHGFGISGISDSVAAKVFTEETEKSKSVTTGV